MIDLIAYERHFIDHLAPVWRALPAELRGQALTEPQLVGHCGAAGIEAEGRRVPIRRSPPGDPERIALIASYGDLKRGRTLGYGAFVRLEHGIGQSYGNGHGSYPGGLDNADVELFLTPNRYAAARWAAVYPESQVEVVGCPKLDDLPARRRGPETVVAISFHWACGMAPETMPAWATYKPVLPELSQRHQLLGHGHPRAMAELSRHYRRLGIEIVGDFAAICERADLFIADNTSALYEFASTGRPVVVLNSPRYRREIQHGLRFWDAAAVGIQVDRAEELLSAVDEALADAPARQVAREGALATVYAHRSGAAQRAAQAISGWLATVSARKVA